MKKLLIVTDAWAPQVNGVATVFATITDLLRKRGIEVTVIHPGLFARVFPFPLYPEIPLAVFPDTRMREIFDREKPEYVHIATEWTLGLSARHLCKKRRIAFTTSYHTNFPLYAAHYFKFGKFFAFFASLYMRWFHGASHAVLVSTESLRKQLLSEGFKEVVLWPFGLDTERFRRSETPPQTGLTSPVFLYMGRVAKEKNIEEFLMAKLPGSKLVIGDGPERIALEKKYGKEVRFVGYKHGQELVDWLSVGDVCVFPSRTETFGMATLESLACGLPIAAHDVMGPRDIVTQGVDGFLKENIAEAATACLQLSRDACRKKALRYSWENSADIFLKHIQTYT